MQLSSSRVTRKVGSRRTHGKTREDYRSVVSRIEELHAECDALREAQKTEEADNFPPSKTLLEQMRLASVPTEMQAILADPNLEETVRQQMVAKKAELESFFKTAEMVATLHAMGRASTSAKQKQAQQEAAAAEAYMQFLETNTQPCVGN